MAFTAEGDCQGKGLAGRLFAALAHVALARGTAVFEADVLSEIGAMWRVFERSGLPRLKRHEGGAIHLEPRLRADRV